MDCYGGSVYCKILCNLFPTDLIAYTNIIIGQGPGDLIERRPFCMRHVSLLHGLSLVAKPDQNPRYIAILNRNQTKPNV